MIQTRILTHVLSYGGEITVVHRPQLCRPQPRVPECWSDLDRGHETVDAADAALSTMETVLAQTDPVTRLPGVTARLSQ